jgi:hypothetical protein
MILTLMIISILDRTLKSLQQVKGKKLEAIIQMISISVVKWLDKKKKMAMKIILIFNLVAKVQNKKKKKKHRQEEIWWIY